MKTLERRNHFLDMSLLMVEDYKAGIYYPIFLFDADN